MIRRLARWWWAQVLAGARLKEWPDDDQPRTMRDWQDSDWDAVEPVEYFPGLPR